MGRTGDSPVCSEQFRSAHKTRRSLVWQADREVDLLWEGRFNMRRREFITLIGGAAAWPVAASGQSATPVVAFLAVGSPDALRRRVVAFRKGLSETGWIEHRNVGVEYHWLEGNYVGLPAVLDDVIRRGVAVLAIPGSVPISVAAKAATATIPIVFGVADDPVLLGLVKSLAHPGGNETGVNFFAIGTDNNRHCL